MSKTCGDGSKQQGNLLWFECSYSIPTFVGSLTYFAQLSQALYRGRLSQESLKLSLWRFNLKNQKSEWISQSYTELSEQAIILKMIVLSKTSMPQTLEQLTCSQRGKSSPPVYQSLLVDKGIFQGGLKRIAILCIVQIQLIDDMGQFRIFALMTNGIEI